MPTRPKLLIVLATSLAGSILFMAVANNFSLTGFSLAGILFITNLLAVLLFNFFVTWSEKKEQNRQRAYSQNNSTPESLLNTSPDLQKLSLVASSTHSAVLFTDLEGRITWVNSGFTRISGYGFEEVIGLKPGDFLQGPLTDADSIHKIRTALSKHEGTRTEVLNYSKTGDVYWLDLEIMPVKAENGAIIGFMSVQSDITALKKALEAQEESGLQMKTILDHAPMVVFMKHKDGKYLFFNEKYKQAVGRPELKPGMTDDDIFDEAFVKVCRQKDQEIIDGEQVVKYEMQVAGRDFFELKFPIQNQHNEIYAVGGISLDVTDLRKMQNDLSESELKFRLITEAAPVYIWMTNEHGKPTFFNRQWLEFVGRSFEDAIKMHWSTEIHPEDLDVCKKVFNFSAGGPSELNCTFRWRNADGIYRWLQMKAVPRRNAESEFLGYIGSSVDVTEQIEIKNKLEQLVEEKEFLIREIHHRVKNNLQVMSSVLFLKAQTLKDPAMRLLLSQSRQRLRSMALIHETLMQSGSQITKIDVKNYLTGLVNEQKQALSVDPEYITVETDIESHMMNIEQVVNLGFIVNETLTNAVKYAFPVQRNGVIRVSFRQTEGLQVLVVEDNGVGLPSHVNLDNNELFGVQLVKIFANHLSAQVALEGLKGTKWKLSFALVG